MTDEKDIKKNSNTRDRIKSFGKKAILSSLLTIPSFAGINANAQQHPQANNETNNHQQEVVSDTTKDNTNANATFKFDEKYMTDITVRNDTINVAGHTQAIYSPDHGEIRIKTPDKKLNNSNSQTTNGIPEELIIIHEREHEIDFEVKGVGKEILSIDQSFHREYHLEIVGLIAEKLEIRQQFKEIKTEEEKKIFFEKFGSIAEHKDYINALKSRLLNPNSNNLQDFINEMAFIKDSSTKYRCDRYDKKYMKSITDNTLIYLMRYRDKIKDNPEGFEKEIKAIYQIGGFDFTSVGNNDLYPMKNVGLEYADKLLEQGADIDKLAKFIDKIKNSSHIPNQTLNWAENLDLKGLSREQAETLLQTAIMAQISADNIAESILLDRGNQEEFSIHDGKEEIAMYLDIKRDIWEKNGTLSEKGDEEKFNQLMQKAKCIEIDCLGWLENSDIFAAARDPIRNKEIKKIAKANQGKIVNVDEYYTKLKLPLTETSVESVLENMRIKEEENKKYWEEYYKNHPQTIETKERLSEPYQIKIMDLQSPILADELNQRIEYDRQQLREELKQQEGELHDTPEMKSQDMRFDMRIAQHSKEDAPKDNSVETKTDTKSNLTTIPQRDFSL